MFNKVEAEHVLKKLRFAEAEITGLMDDVSPESFNAHDLESLRDRYGQLKDRLKSDAIAASKLSGHFERAYWEPAVRKAFVKLTPARNSHPIKSAWYSKLSDARHDIRHLLRQLEKQVEAQQS